MGYKVQQGFWKGFFDAFSTTGWLYAVLYFILIIMFAYFYITIQYNPVEMANNLRQNNGTIPGIRPGKPTSDFIAKILSQDYADRRTLPCVYRTASDYLQQRHRHARPDAGRNLDHHFGWCCFGNHKADRISDDDAPLQRASLD